MKENIIQLFIDTINAVEEHKEIYCGSHDIVLVEDIALRVANLVSCESRLSRFYCRVADMLHKIEKKEGVKREEGYFKLLYNIKQYFIEYVGSILFKYVEIDIENKKINTVLCCGDREVFYTLCGTLESEKGVGYHCNKLANELIDSWYTHRKDVQFFVGEECFKSLYYYTKILK